MNLVLNTIIRDLYILSEAAEARNDFKTADDLTRQMVQTACASKLTKTAQVDGSAMKDAFEKMLKKQQVDDTKKKWVERLKSYQQATKPQEVSNTMSPDEDEPSYYPASTKFTTAAEDYDPYAGYEDDYPDDDEPYEPYVPPSQLPKPKRPDYEKDYGWTKDQFINHMKNYPGIKPYSAKQLDNSDYYGGHFWVMPKGDLYKLPGYHAPSIEHVKNKFGIDPNDYEHPANNERSDYSFFINGSGGSIRVYLSGGVNCIAHGIPDKEQIKTLRNVVAKKPGLSFAMDWTSDDGNSSEYFTDFASFERHMYQVANSKGPVEKRRISPLTPFLHDERQYKLNR